jgi:FAD/FMN-containing dehydrogenase
MAILPPGVSAGQFASAIREFEAVLGRDWVFTTEEDLHPYRDHFSYIKDQPNELIPSAAVGPDTVEQVQGIVRVANKYKIPLYAISTGKNFAYGGPSPNVRGSVTVDLKRMNRVLQVDDKRHFALVEPGVSYFDLYRHIQERGLKVWVDTPDPGWGSLIGNAMDHGIGYTMGFYRDHFGARPTARCCAREWARCRAPIAGRNTSTASAPTRPASSGRAISESSRRWASG